MIQVTIPGRETLNLEIQLSTFLEIHILTSDTYGTVAHQCKGLPVQVNVLGSMDHTTEKADYLSQFNNQEIIAIGNGANDHLMLKRAHLGIGVIGFEGASVQALLSADLLVNKIEEAFGLLIEPQRLKATLRR